MLYRVVPDLTSHSAQLIDLKLSGTLTHLVTVGRRDGKSWRRLALDIRDRTGIEIAHETLRGWFADIPGKAAS
jgi:hypothetical protein